MNRTLFIALVLALPFGLSGCQLEQLQKENADLQADVAELQAKIQALRDAARSSGTVIDLTEIDSFKVGFAAAEVTFDESAFREWLMESLRHGVTGAGNFRVQRESDDREVDKIRGMLVQQYLAAEEIPIKISNLTYKLQTPTHDFRIGSQVVPRNNTEIVKTSSAGAAQVRHADEINATMERDIQGRYSISYEEIGGGEGRIPVAIRDIEIMDPNQEPQFARQGDISFNWNLNLAKVVVYRVDNYQGDVGAFMLKMKYPKGQISQYQTLRDSVFLFGYGNYNTSLVSEIRTPADITVVDVLPLDSSLANSLEAGASEQELVQALGSGSKWIPCEFIRFEGGERVWKRPVEVGLPFVSRQRSETKMHTFYTKYTSRGAELIGDFEQTERLSR